MALSTNVLMPEHIPVSLRAIYRSSTAAAYPTRNGVRKLYAAARHNQQLRELHGRLVGRCAEFDDLYQLFAEACESTLRQHLRESSSTLKDLLEQLAICTHNIKPVLADMELTPPVLSSMAGNWNHRKAFTRLKEEPELVKVSKGLRQQWLQCSVASGLLPPLTVWCDGLPLFSGTPAGTVRKNLQPKQTAA